MDKCDNKYSGLGMARLDVLSEKIDQQICHLIHKETLKRFSSDAEVEEITLPAELNHLKKQKSFLCHLADGMGINISSNSQSGICITKEPDPIKGKYSLLEVTKSSLNLIAEDLKNVHMMESDTSQVSRDRVANRRFSNVNGVRCAGRLNILDKPPDVLLLGESADYVRHRRSLPIYRFRLDILSALEHQQVVIIAGDVGSGKTTQVPQYILEDAHEKKTPCRIICVQPRRMSVIAAVDRVTAERGVTGERLIGFQIPLESRGTMNCPLTFCTTGVFLRTLNESDRCLKGITHIIVDQAHERDRFTDLLLGFLRLRLAHYPSLRLVLLCANVGTQMLASYFHQDKFIQVCIPTPPVSQFFLEDILTCTKFLSKQILLEGAGTGSVEQTIGPSTVFDEYISDAWFKGSEHIFHHLLNFVRHGEMSIDYQHSQTGITLLMAAAIHGNLDVVKAAVGLGANPTFTVKGMTPHDLANEFARPEVADLLWSYSQIFSSEIGNNIRIMQPSAINQESPDEVLRHFYAKYSQDHANLDLIIEVLSFVQGYCLPGAILVFLPAYSEVIELRDMIAASTSSLRHKLQVHTLHGYLPLNDFRKLFEPPAQDKRKVILTTNFAETSIFFDDVACVVDSGLIRDKENEVVFTNSHKTSWISKISVAQRLLHVRNGGLYFHLYPRSKLEGFQELPVPEITRHSLVDVALYARVIVPEDVRLPQFFCNLPDSPPTTAVHQAMAILESIEALDSGGKATEVGCQLMELPIDPRLGKMILVALVLKCLDPVLTIACCLARDDPFLLPSSPDERKIAMMRKYELVAEHLSDHLALLRAYHLWEKANDEVRKRQVCQDNFLSASVFELVFLLRVNMVGELRASGYIKGRGQCDIRNLNLHSETWTAIKAALTAGLYPNVARYSPVNGNIVTHDEMRSQFHFSSTLLAQETKINSSGVDNDTHLEGGVLFPQSVGVQQPKLYNLFPLKPWIIFEEQQRAGQFMIIRCCTAITPVMLLLFAGHSGSCFCTVKSNQINEHSLIDDSSDDDLDDIDDEEIRQLCLEYNFQHMSDHILEFNHSIKKHKKFTKPRTQNIVLKLDDFVGFTIDSYAAQLILAIRHKFQTIVSKCIRDPGRSCNANEDAVLRTVLSVLSSEEMAMSFQQPTGVGRRPTNVSADSMFVTPDLKPGDVFPIRRYLTYTPPPKGYLYETKLETKSKNQFPLGVKDRPKPAIQEFKHRTVDSVAKSFSSLSMLNSSWPTYGSTNPGGRRIFKSYKNE